MAHNDGGIGVVAVAGGAMVFGDTGVGTMPELYDEGSGRWFTLPHAMIQPRAATGMASVPAALVADRLQ
jgi:hypothetical protein